MTFDAEASRYVDPDTVDPLDGMRTLVVVAGVPRSTKVPKALSLPTAVQADELTSASTGQGPLCLLLSGLAHRFRHLSVPSACGRRGIYPPDFVATLAVPPAIRGGALDLLRPVSYCDEMERG